ncbi:MAG: hypothetical protein RIR52_2438 [Acidobacteriota bacterium]
MAGGRPAVVPALRTVCLILLVALLLPAMSVMPLTTLMASSAPGHKFHVSVSQVEYDRAKQTARIMIRVFADDLQAAVSRHVGRELKIQGAPIGNDREMGGLIHSYVRDRLELRTRDGREVRLGWAGLEATPDVIWLYVEGRVAGGLAGTRLRNRLFCELFEDQVNIVNTIHQQKTIGVMFEPKDDFKALTERQTRP